MEVGEVVVTTLEKADYLSHVIPFGEYGNYSRIPSLEASTVIGRQDLHVHTDSGSIIQFWKPAKDKYWYDRDVFKSLVWDAVFREDELFDEKNAIIRSLLSGSFEKIFPLKNTISFIKEYMLVRNIAQYKRTIEDPSFPDIILL